MLGGLSKIILTEVNINLFHLICEHHGHSGGKISGEGVKGGCVCELLLLVKLKYKLFG